VLLALANRHDALLVLANRHDALLALANRHDALLAGGSAALGAIWDRSLLAIADDGDRPLLHGAKRLSRDAAVVTCMHSGLPCRLINEPTLGGQPTLSAFG
jgi:hypothetical protein